VNTNVQTTLFGEVLAELPKRRKQMTVQELLRDMNFQPQRCKECGAQNRREGATLICRNGHEGWIELTGRPDHPQYEAFCRYMRSVGNPID